MGIGDDATNNSLFPAAQSYSMFLEQDDILVVVVGVDPF